MWRWFRHASIDALSVSMVGVKLADRLLVIGCSDPRLIAALGVKAGLTGRACAADESSERVARTARIALREGALVDMVIAPYSMLPFDNASFDVVVVRDVFGALDPEPGARASGEARRVLRPGGRCLAIDTIAPSGLARLLNRAKPSDQYAGTGVALQALQIHFAGVRILAEREGLVFVEAVKANR